MWERVARPANQDIPAPLKHATTRAPFVNCFPSTGSREHSGYISSLPLLLDLVINWRTLDRSTRDHPGI